MKKTTLVMGLLCLALIVPKTSFGLIKAGLTTPLYSLYPGIVKSEGFTKSPSSWGVGANLYLSTVFLGPLSVLPVDLMLRVSHNSISAKQQRANANEITINATTQNVLIGAAFEILFVHVAAAVGGGISNISAKKSTGIKYKSPLTFATYIEAGFSIFPLVSILIGMENIFNLKISETAPSNNNLKSTLNPMLFNVGIRVGL